MDLKYLWWLAGIAGTLVVLGWTAHETLATKGDLDKVTERIEIAGYQAQFALDQQIEDVSAKIARLEEKINRGEGKAADIENLRYWRGVLQRLRAIRSGKK